ncbi:hypothetical protein AAC387_Pa05g1225 [Persea americana]
MRHPPVPCRKLEVPTSVELIEASWQILQASTQCMVSWHPMREASLLLAVAKGSRLSRKIRRDVEEAHPCSLGERVGQQKKCALIVFQRTHFRRKRVLRDDQGTRSAGTDAEESRKTSSHPVLDVDGTRIEGTLCPVAVTLAPFWVP